MTINLKKLKNATNEELLEQIMKYSSYGGLSQVFVMAAIELYAKHVLSQTEEQHNKAMGFICHKSYQGVAQEVLDALDARTSK